MDIQRKPRYQASVKPSIPVEEHVLPEFFSGAPTRPPIAPGPYYLGEEQVWYEQEEKSTRQEWQPDVRNELLGKVVTPLKKSKNRSTFFSGRSSWPSFLKKGSLSFRQFFWWAIFLGALLVLYGFIMKNSIEDHVEVGLAEVQKGIDLLAQKKFPEAQKSLSAAEKNLSTARLQTLYFPVFLARPLSHIPGLERVGSGVLALDAATHLVRAAQEGTAVLGTLSRSQEKNLNNNNEPLSYLALLADIEAPLGTVRTELEAASYSLKGISLDAIPEKNQFLVTILQKSVPGVIAGIDSLLANTPLVEELLGGNGPRTYLFLFQNNQELRPTGGFIGTYGILEFKDGQARRFFIDGIFNPDGQLRENIIPPKAIQKISAGWSLHDSNWFPDFPTSAEKAIFFYEKTGGPTVDGVFTLTPTVMERLLALTGPIELPEYGITVDTKNFIATIQEQVEIKYDKEENKPKKVLGDLASILMERIFATTDPLVLYQIANILVDGMNEKQILLYTRNEETQKLIAAAGWSGKIDDTTHDYLNVIHTNINGYKTDGVIDESIEHAVSVEPDGTLVATASITRTHTGGNTPYDWWNRVNSNYMRVYVPLGSQLITATGHTREFPPEPLDYAALGFKKDETIRQEEESIEIDEKTGTRVGEEFGKTVFGNWVYVSPGESVTVQYTYLLPFRLQPGEPSASSYALLFQKQPGVDKVHFKSTLEYPKSWNLYWQSDPSLLQTKESGIQLERSLGTDAFWGVVFKE